MCALCVQNKEAIQKQLRKWVHLSLHILAH